MLSLLRRNTLTQLAMAGKVNSAACRVFCFEACQVGRFNQYPLTLQPIRYEDFVRNTKESILKELEADARPA